MRKLRNSVASAAVVFLACASGLAGCATDNSYRVSNPQRVYTYPGGQYELHGDGTATSPFYWVWIPASATSVPAPPPAPAAALGLGQRAYTYPEGRYELRGDGTAATPYYWVWIPAGTLAGRVSVPAPPALPVVTAQRAGQRVYSYPHGQYELHGDGTAANPYYWVWIPTGVTSVPASPPAPSIVIGQMGQREYAYPEGRYELRGDGTAGNPYYWAWIPVGAASAALMPAPPPAPSASAGQPGQLARRIYTYPQGQYELYGDGSANNPYYWVWIPSGVASAASIPAPPPAPNAAAGQLTQRTFTYPEGRYELRGDGTAGNPFFWTWIPVGAQTMSAPPLPPFPPRS
jgi:hypothetical protein